MKLFMAASGEEQPVRATRTARHSGGTVGLLIADNGHQTTAMCKAKRGGGKVVVDIELQLT